MKTITLQLETLSCPSCIRKIESALSSLNGVKEVRVLFNASKVKAQIDSAQSSAELLVETVENLGFKVLSHK
ncbi:MAG: heavy-metal-associated domain-containing protein [Alcaligenaceae bacterium]|nr:heavy-metal-associated domain-containing protein [Alcaligenaceae bacterium]